MTLYLARADTPDDWFNYTIESWGNRSMDKVIRTTMVLYNFIGENPNNISRFNSIVSLLKKYCFSEDIFQENIEYGLVFSLEKKILTYIDILIENIKNINNTLIWTYLLDEIKYDHKTILDIICKLLEKNLNIEQKYKNKIFQFAAAHNLEIFNILHNKFKWNLPENYMRLCKSVVQQKHSYDIIQSYKTYSLAEFKNLLEKSIDIDSAVLRPIIYIIQDFEFFKVALNILREKIQISSVFYNEIIQELTRLKKPSFVKFFSETIRKEETS